MSIRLRLLIIAVLLATFVAGGWLILKDTSVDVLQPTGVVAAQQKDLFWFTIALSALVVIPVYGLLALFAIKYRASNVANVQYTPNWSENKKLEALWWGIPIIIIVVLAVVTYQTSHSLDPYKKIGDEKSLEVQVVALRWKWLFLYPEYGIATINHVPLPVDTPVHFSLSADAPMSAFWIPSLGSQIYAMNGMTSELNLQASKVGNYTGYTTNINGEGYAKMIFKTKVMSGSSFNDWVGTAAASKVPMQMETYHSVSKPVSDTNEYTYRLTNKNLYDEIVAMHMGHGGHHD